jgi:periplasmic copper chaperone A
VLITRRPLTLLAALALVVGAAACGDDDDTDTGGNGDDVTAEVTVEDAWARTSPMAASNGAAYMILTSTVDDRLVAASVDEAVAATAEVHETAMDDETGEMAMREVAGIDLPAGTAVTLEPGGYHVMLLDLASPLEPGTTIEVTLTFEEAGEQTVTVEVRDGAMDGGMDRDMDQDRDQDRDQDMDQDGDMDRDMDQDRDQDMGDG